MDTTLRPMRQSDIAAGLELCRASGWNQTARDWELLLTLAPAGSFVAEADGRIVGTVMALSFRPAFDWIAMMLVEASLRGKGIGRALMRGALESSSSGVVRLDATAEGRRLYVTLGFADEFGVSRWRAAPAIGGPAASSISPIDEEDWEDISALDRPVFGANRLDVLKWCRREAPEYAWLSRTAGRLDGFVLGRHGHASEHLGPIVASEADVAIALLDTCLNRAGERSVTVDVPDSQDGFRRALEARAFARQRMFTRMRRGARALSVDPEAMFAISGPELG